MTPDGGSGLLMLGGRARTAGPRRDDTGRGITAVGGASGCLTATDPAAETIAPQLRDHQTALQDWSFAGMAQEQHRWTEIFDVEFKLRLPSYPVFKFASVRNAYATCAASRQELGTKDNITFNANELSREAALILHTLCHELVHLWQRYHGAPSRSRYHNVQFHARARRCGLLVESGGYTRGHTQTFAEVLERHGIRLGPRVAETAEVRLWGAGRRELKMKKWRCTCTTVRCATYLRARCERCGQRFSLA